MQSYRKEFVESSGALVFSQFQYIFLSPGKLELSAAIVLVHFDNHAYVQNFFGCMQAQNVIYTTQCTFE